VDVHRSVIVGCALVSEGGGRVRKVAREFLIGEDYFDKRNTQRVARRYVRRLDDLGFAVTLQPFSQLAPAAANAF
jgi:hypothetical protein